MGRWSAETVVDAVDVREQQQSLGLHRARQHDRGEILVDDRLDAARPACGVEHDRHSASATCDYEEASIDEAANGVGFEQPEWFG